MIIDASVAVKLIIVEEGSDRAAEHAARSELVAPFLLLSEVGNVLCKAMRRKMITSSLDLFSRFAGLKALIHFESEQEDVDRALELAVSMDHSVYYCVYLAQAMRLKRPLLTADAHFARKIAGHAALVEVIAL